MKSFAIGHCKFKPNISIVFDVSFAIILYKFN